MAQGGSVAKLAKSYLEALSISRIDLELALRIAHKTFQ